MGYSYSDSSSSTTHDVNYAQFRLIVTVIVLVLEFLFVGIVFCSIKCCCPTALRKVRMGLVLSDDTRVTRPTVQPVVIQNVMPVEHVPMDPYQPPPPQYSVWHPDQASNDAIEVPVSQPLIETKSK